MEKVKRGKKARVGTSRVRNIQLSRTYNAGLDEEASVGPSLSPSVLPRSFFSLFTPRYLLRVPPSSSACPEEATSTRATWKNQNRGDYVSR